MRRFRFMKEFISVVVFLALIPMMAFNAMGAGIDIYGEGAYSDAELNVYLYADISQERVLCYGVKLLYNPSELTVSAVEKDITPVPYTSNTAKWYLGEDTATYRNNPPPDTATPGEVVIIGGKVDPANPTAGIHSGTKIFLGKVTFVPVGAEMPANPVLTLSLARDVGNYDNFVRLDEGSTIVMDGADVSFGDVKIAALGDANADSTVNFQDMLFVKYIAQTGGNNTPYADCNLDGIINFQDMLCIRAKTQ